ncbi:MAG: LuxR C-terminal-related transcriptional regulator, partial [Chloroflexota bacterium]|nr:LuxR C-terminal-related transcriptional regulator [Chloroflexota bacterium]
AYAELLGAITRALPAGSQLAVATREAPELNLGRLRADRLVSEFGASDLAMNVAEGSATLAACGLELRPDSVERLVDRTEGWPVGLYLPGLSLSNRPGADEAPADFHGDDRLVADYMRDELLRGLDPETLNFLIGTSILDRLSGEACDAVLDRPGSGEVLHQLTRSNLLIVPLDGRDRFFRLHALFRDVLLSELDSEPAPVAAALHARASEFFTACGDIDRAVQHGIASGDPEPVATLILSNTPAYVTSGRHATVKGWLARFTTEQLGALPALSLAKAICGLAEGDGGEIERWTCTALEALEGSDGYPAMAVMARIIRAAGASRDGVGRMLSDIDAGIGFLASDDPLRVLCNLLRGVALHLTARRGEARRPLEDGARMGASVGPSIAAICRAQLALLALDEGDVAEAERQSQHAVGTVDHFGLGDYKTHALTFAVAALVCARRGRTDAAAQHAKSAARLQAGREDLSPWYEAESRITLGRALLFLDEVVAARSNLSAARRFLRDASDAVVLREWLDAAWADAEAAESVEGRWPLTPAELRLLHLLPTHHSFREIAELSFVSQNTVKTQAQSVYRKLGVSSRAEAVSCARAAGLLSSGIEDSP